MSLFKSLLSAAIWCFWYCALVLIIVYAAFAVVGVDFIQVAFSAETSPTSTIVEVPWGDLLSSNVDVIATALIGVGLWMVRHLPAQLRSVLYTWRVDQLLTKAVVYGCNSVAGAAKGQTLSIDVQNHVLAWALQFAVNRLPAAILRWLGGPEKLAENIWNRLDVSAEASRPDLAAIAAAIAAGKSPALAAAAV